MEKCQFGIILAEVRIMKGLRRRSSRNRHIEGGVERARESERWGKYGDFNVAKLCQDINSKQTICLI